MADYKNFTVETDSDGIALITWDMPGRSMNVIDDTVGGELKAIIENVTTNDSIKGAVIASGKKTFGAGADLSMLEELLNHYAEAKAKDPEQAAKDLFASSYQLNQNLRALETSGKPWVAAINGTALGGCFEITLACHARVASEDGAVGLPEVKVGLLPGGGGTQRVIRMVNPQDAVQMLLQGTTHRAAKAKSLGLIHEVVPADQLIEAAKQKIRDGLKAEQPWDQKGYKAPLNLWSPAGVQMLSAGNALLRKNTYANYPNAMNIMSCVYEGIQLPMDRALEVESRYFTHTLTTPEAKAMIRTLFMSMQELNKGARRPDVEKTNIKKVGVLGAGFMGAGIAYVSAKAGLEVVLIDRDQEAADKGKAYSEDILDKAIARKRSTPEKKAALLDLITATTDYAAFKDCDLIVEAVFEDKEIKRQVTEATDAVTPEGTVFASNTSTIPITELAEAAKSAENFIGIHFFSPVDKMMLVEIIMGEKTGDKALAMAIDYVTKIKKTPIVVNDTRGFYVNRAVMRYMQEAWNMLIAGVPAAMIENGAKMAGMPVGPLALNDEVAIDLSQKVMKQTVADLGENAVDPNHVKLVNTMVTDNGRVGRKGGKGFYEYPEKPGKKHLWPELANLYPQQDADNIAIKDVMDRYLYTIALEAARCVEEGVVTDVREADVGAILGFGFAPYSGGPITFIDQTGLVEFKARAEELAAQYGDHFSPPQIIKDMAAKGESFYGSSPQAKAA